MNQLVVDLNITAEELLKHYQGVAKVVSATSRDGRRVQFPSNILQPFISRDGVRGSFMICFHDDNKFAGIQRLD